MIPALSFRTERGPCSRTHPPTQPTTTGTLATARNPMTTCRPRVPRPIAPHGQPGACTRTPGRRACSCLCLPGPSIADRFTQSGPAADMPPDPLLATIIDTVTGPDGPGVAGLTDDQLIGVIAAVRRLESRAAWYLLAAVAEFAARQEGEGSGEEFAADQLACELHLTVPSAAAADDYASTVTARLPRCLAARPRADAPGARADHRRGDPDPVRGGRRQGRCGTGRDRGVADLREAAVGGAPAGPGAGPGVRGAAEGRRPAGRARAAVPGDIRQRRDDRPGTARR